jgi:biopolymer transport protein TolR
VRRPEQAKPDINVTPLVDVVLVLLIIFMVIIPQMEAGAAVNLPGVQHPDEKTDAKHKPVTVSVTASGNLYLEKQLVSREQLMDGLRQVHAVAPNRRVILKGDREASYGFVRGIFKDCQKVGFPGVSLQAGDKRPSENEGK